MQNAYERTSRRGESDDGRLACLMVETLEEGLSRLRDRPARILEMLREPLPSVSSFHRERLRATLEGGKTLRVFFKDLNPEHQTEKARTVRARDLAPSLRELRMYQSVLSPQGDGTLYLYASRWAPERGLYWICLEAVGRTLLHNFVDMGRWTAAARWAARFHAATRSLPDAQTEFLPRYDEAHYRGCLDRVEKILPNLGAPERELVRCGLDCYARRIKWLSGLPRCVIQGQLFGRNIMLRRATGDRQIMVIDWETAAVGPPAFDLVRLTAGRWNEV